MHYSNSNGPTLAQARADWKTRFSAAYFDSNVGFVTVAMVIASLIALAASGDLSDATMLAVCAGWALAMPLVLALPASMAAGPYPSASQYADRLEPVPVLVPVETNDHPVGRAD
jgi:hypothetical protein